jgi:hypothetical protein
VDDLTGMREAEAMARERQDIIVVDEVVRGVRRVEHVDTRLPLTTSDPRSMFGSAAQHLPDQDTQDAEGTRSYDRPHCREH